MFGKIFDTTEVDKYADWVVDEIKRTLPSEGTHGNTKKVAVRTEKLNQRLARETENLARMVRLNIYKKARIASRIRELMSAAGYGDSFTKALSMDLINRLEVASKAAKR